MTSTVHLSTPYGPAGFLVTFTEQGEIVQVESAAAQLPETVFRLTHGDNWETARAYFENLATYLQYPLEFVIWKKTVRKKELKRLQVVYNTKLSKKEQVRMQP